MLKCQTYTKSSIVFALFFLIGCSSVKDRAKPRKPYHDPEIEAFMEGNGDFEQDTSRSFSPEKQYSNRQRPRWATTRLQTRVSKNYIARVGNREIGNKQSFEVEASLKKRLIELITGDVETRVETVIEDSVVSRIVQHGKEKEKIREHILKVMRRHHSPELIFNGVYDEEETWVDENNDTLWLLIKFNKAKYINDKEQRIIEEIKDAQEKTYQNLKTSFKALSHSSDMEKALTALGLASFWISKGGGSVDKDDLFHPGNKQNLLMQRHELIKEIDKSIGLRLINDKDKNIATRDKPFKAKIRCSNPKGYDLNKVKLRIRADSDMLGNYPESVKLEPDGSAEIPFLPKNDIYGNTVSVSVTFDVISDLIPKKRWYRTPDYSDLLKELPGKKFKIETKEFTPVRTWAFVHSNDKKLLKGNSDFFQSILKKELSNYRDLIDVIPHEKWPVDYKKVLDLKLGKRSYKSLGKYRQEVQKHDLDIMLKLHYDDGWYTVILEGTGPAEGAGGIISVQIDTVTYKSIKKTIGTIVEQFVTDNFHRRIELKTPVKGDIRVFVNGKKMLFEKNSDNQLLLRGLSRFETQKLIAKSPGYRKQIFSADGKPFSLHMKQWHISSFEMDQLVPEQGTLKVSVVDSLTQKLIRFGGRRQGTAPIITVRKMYWFIPSLRKLVSDTGSTVLFPIDKLGIYSVKVNKNFYNNPIFPKKVWVYDDEDPRHIQSNSIRFALLKKDIGRAKKKSAIIPGWGHFSLGKKKQGIGFMSGVIFTVGWAIFHGKEFRNERDSYNRLKDNYLNSPEGDWVSYEHDLDSSKNRIINYRNNVYGGLFLYAGVWLSSYLTIEL